VNDFNVSHEERRLNVECGQAIDRAMHDSYKPGPMAGTGYYDNKTAVKTVIDAYGADRVAGVLAANINYHDNDGRLTRANKEWAKSIETTDKPDYYFNTHLTVINSFAVKLREVMREIDERQTQTAAKGNSTVTITLDSRKENGWIKGETSGGVTFEAKVYDEPSEYGIDGGRVSKLGVHEGNKWIVNYDRGWDLEPLTPEHNTIYEQIMSKLNSLNATRDLNMEQAFIPPEKSETAKNVENYLTGKMGLDKGIVKSCIERGLVYQTEVHSEKLDKDLPCAVFAGFDEAGEMQSAVIKGFGTYEKVAPESQLKYAFVLPAKESKDKPASAVSVFENPLEVLAGATLAKMGSKIGYDGIHRMSAVKSWLYSTHVKALEAFLQSNPNVRTVNLCLTSSADGKVLADRINTMLKNLGEQRMEYFKVNSLIPTDANGYLDKLQNKNKETKAKQKPKENRE
jgi:hypothetical protein